MKRKPQKLSLSREVIRTLDVRDLPAIAAGDGTGAQGSLDCTRTLTGCLAGER